MIEIITSLADAQDVYDFAAGLDPGWRCNQSAVLRGEMERSHPKLRAVEGFIGREDAMVIVSHVGALSSPIRGYLIVVDDSEGKHGGCHGRWVGVTGSRPHMVETAVEMLSVAADEYGWVWGRVGNIGLHDIFRDDIPEGAELRVDREVLTFRRSP